MKLASYFLIAIAIILSGCATTVGVDFDDSKINKIRTGKSTKENVSSLLGSPYGKNSSANGTSIWTYQFIKSDSHLTAMSFVPLLGALKGGEVESSTRTLVVSFNKSDIVASCLYRTYSGSGTGILGRTEVMLGNTGFGKGEVVAMNCEDVR